MKSQNLKNIILWVISLLLIYSIVSFLFYPIHFSNLKNKIIEPFGRFYYKEAIPVLDKCDLSSAKYASSIFGIDVKQMINYDCSNACEEKNLKYISYGCKENKLTCFCR